MSDPVINSVYEEARIKYCSASHDFSHAVRVADHCHSIAPSVSADIRICTVAALLHDIGRSDRSEHEHFDSSEDVRKLLDGKFDPVFIGRVVKCIERHSSSSLEFPESPEEKTIFDADKLDGYGYTGVARFFTYAGENRLDIKQALNEAIRRMESIERRGSFLTPAGRRMGRSRAFRAFAYYLSLAREFGLEDEEIRMRDVLIASQGKIAGNIALALIKLLY
ncbi:HD domain-containing protein [Methanooceanicella nereidis]|nr:HD domain-containing protein [Methanocella sp. CWC-04]